MEEPLRFGEALRRGSEERVQVMARPIRQPGVVGAAPVVAALMLVALTAVALLAGGCSQISELRRSRAEDRTLDAVARRMKALERIEAGGRFEIRQGEAVLSLPFVMRLERGGVLEVEAEISEGPSSSLGRVRIVSDASGTEIYAPGGPAEVAWADSLGPVLRPLLLSVFGGGDMLVHWLLASRCDPVRETRCCGVEVSLRMSRERGSVERWTIRDPARRVSFTGFVHSWSDAGPFPRIVTGMVHPYEVGISVEFNEIDLAQGCGGQEKTGLVGNFGKCPGFQ